jgi:hypothetical protein
MRSAVKLTAAWSAACVVAIALPAPAAPPDSRAADEGRWVPSLALSGGATIQQQESSVTSFCEEGGPGDPAVGFATCNFLLDPGRAPLRPAESGTDWAVSPFVGANFQLMTPAIKLIPGRPRLFVVGEIQLTFPPTLGIALEGDPSNVRLPETIARLQDTSAFLLQGVGSKTSSEIQTLGWGAGVGVAFPFRFRGRRLWVKPSAAWTRYTIDVEGLVVAGLKDDPLPGTFCAIGQTCAEPRDPLAGGPVSDWPSWGSQVREIRLSGSSSKTGDRKIAFSDRNDTLPALDPVIVPADPGPPPTSAIPGNPNGLPADAYSASWSFEVDPWLFRAGVGVRFHWLGP